MSIASVAAAIVAVGNKANSVQTAMDPPPPAINSADVPLLYVLVGEAEYDETSPSSERLTVTRFYNVQVAVLGVGNASPHERETIGRAVLEDVQDTFAQYPKLGRAQYVVRSRIVRDSGIVILPDWNQKWVGFEIRLAVTETAQRSYASGE